MNRPEPLLDLADHPRRLGPVGDVSAKREDAGLESLELAHELARRRLRSLALLETTAADECQTCVACGGEQLGEDASDPAEAAGHEVRAPGAYAIGRRVGLGQGGRCERLAQARPAPVGDHRLGGFGKKLRRELLDEGPRVGGGRDGDVDEARSEPRHLLREDAREAERRRDDRFDRLTGHHRESARGDRVDGGSRVARAREGLEQLHRRHEADQESGPSSLQAQRPRRDVGRPAVHDADRSGVDGGLLDELAQALRRLRVHAEESVGHDLEARTGDDADCAASGLAKPVAQGLAQARAVEQDEPRALASARRRRRGDRKPGAGVAVLSERSRGGHRCGDLLARRGVDPVALPAGRDRAGGTPSAATRRATRRPSRPRRRTATPCRGPREPPRSRCGVRRGRRLCRR